MRSELERKGLTPKALILGITLAFLGTFVLWGPVLVDLRITSGVRTMRTRVVDTNMTFYWVSGMGMFLLIALALSLINRVRPHRPIFTLPEILVAGLLPMSSLVFWNYGHHYGIREVFLSIATMPIGISHQTEPEAWWGEIPNIYGPKDAEFWRNMLEGSTFNIPWGSLVTPMSWMLFFGLGFSFCLLFASLLFRREYVHVESLPFPTGQMVADIALTTQPGARTTAFKKYFAAGTIIAFVWSGLGILPNWISPWFADGAQTAWDTGDFLGIYWLCDLEDATMRAMIPSVPIILRVSPWHVGWGLLLPVEQLYGYVAGWSIFGIILPVILVGAGFATAWSPGARWGSYAGAANPLNQAMPGYLGAFPFGLLLALAVYPVIAHRRTMLRILTSRTPVGDRPPISYLATLIAMIASGVLWVAVASWVFGGLALQYLVYAVMMVITLVGLWRLQAQSGGLWGSSHLGFQQNNAEITQFVGSPLLASSFGTASFTTLLMFQFYTSFAGLQGMIGNSQVGQLSLNSFKIAEITRTSEKDMFWTILISIVVSCVVGVITVYFWYFVRPIPPAGLVIERAWVGAARGIGTASTRLQDEMVYTFDPREPGMIQGWATWIALAIIIVFAMNFLRSRFIWFTLAPAGLATAVLWGHFVWVPMFVATFLKWLILKIWGAQRFEGKIRPLALGLVCGIGVAMFLKQVLTGLWINYSLAATQWI